MLWTAAWDSSLNKAIKSFLLGRSETPETWILFRMTHLVWTLKSPFLSPLPWLPLMHDLLHKIYLFTEPNQRKMRSTFLGLACVHLQRLNNEDDNNDDDVFRTHSSPVGSGRKGIRGNWAAPGEPQWKQKSGLNERKWTTSDRPESQALFRTVFRKDTWDIFCNYMTQITWGNLLNGGTIGADGHWQIRLLELLELTCHFFYCAHNHTHFYGD